MASQWGQFRVLTPVLKETFAPKKLRAPKKPRQPSIGGNKVPKVPTPGGY